MELPRIRRICPCISVPITQQIEDLVIFLDFVPMYTHPLLSVQLNIIYQEFLWIVPTLYFRAKSGNMSVFFIVQALSPRTENMKDIEEADNLNLCVLHIQKTWEHSAAIFDRQTHCSRSEIRKTCRDVQLPFSTFNTYFQRRAFPHRLFNLSLRKRIISIWRFIF